jgi:hypothetical protein
MLTQIKSDSRRLKPPGRFPLSTKVTEFPTYRVVYMRQRLE